jgi:hypothetical protein
MFTRDELQACYSLETARADAKRLAALTGRPWVVCELDPTCEASKRARKLGMRVFHSYPEGVYGSHAKIELHLP